MKNIYSKIRLLCNIVLSTILLLVLSTNATAQVEKQFTQRTSIHASPQHIKPNSQGKIYNLRGDFKLAGNTNLTLTNYNVDGNNSENLSYVDIDLDASTINSSSAVLDITNDACNEIVYAGLYWSGRADTGNQTFTGYSTNPQFANTSSNVTFSHNNFSNGFYKLEILTQGSIFDSNPLFRFNFEGQIVEFNFTNFSGNGAVMYRYGTSGTWLNIPGTYSTSNLTGNRYTFATPFTITVNGRDYKINYLNRDSSSYFTDYTNSSLNNAGVNLKAVTFQNTSKILDKTKVKLKKEGGTYQTITANQSDIRYPNGTNGNMYAAYADVTQYVRANKGGNYFVADLATTAGVSDATGHYGGWGLVVVYANANMKWRDITVFDGYAYVAGGATANHQLPISGFKAAQSGPVNIDIGVMAGEGDRSITGDTFKIRNAVNSSWQTLSHSGNSTDNFFNSSILTSSSRFPSLVNNTGIDIVKFNIPNINNNIIPNNASSTTFEYASIQDTYIIYSLVFAVDAYVPEAEAENLTISIKTLDSNGNSIVISDPASVTSKMQNLKPNDEVTMNIKLFNYGNERILNGKIDIDIPNGMKLVSASQNKPTNPILNADVSGEDSGYSLPFSNPTYINPISPSIPEPANGPKNTHGGIIRWNLGTIPVQTLQNGATNKKVLSTLTYTLKVTDDCAVLRTSNGSCSLTAKVDGNISGIGQNSGSTLKQNFIINRLQDCNNSAIYGNLNFVINPDQAFINSCPSQLTGEKLYFEYFCELPFANSVIPRNLISDFYPQGTRFYSVSPAAANFNINNPITGNFTVVLENINVNNPLDGREDWFYALLPETSNTGCFYNIHIKVVAIGTAPEVINGLEFCNGSDFDIPVVLTPEEILDPNIQLRYYNSDADNATAITIDKNALGLGSHTFYVSKVILGTNGAIKCASIKVPVTFIIKGCSMKVNPQIYQEFKRP